ncbi:globin [Ferrimonas balearica DSM 9799]|uniref:Globin n=1 Tax=Ferrimonas balearica (strain DSM 9799 / CCM 4581 / KCTC 23876 / PAT) TaxID=550540 RepID=E1SV92_FERBD|nr:group II truncated hemoglobin [Ferrimonas balearica]ADN74246.1 globin [Ferrimonas balearica DSM 9799]MBW3166719.1 group II truncated hemoglobin [Ferrimonas balearica]MBY6108771.1 group II truncated hemoglobin [Ferrimonas balearica]MBY6226488.1 group II truncated hemoglobin [Ferrimonas balearica]
MLSLIRRHLSRKQPASAYERMGGEPTVRAIAHRFYQLMADDPDYADLRAIHPDDLSGSELKLFEFLSGWLGGPPLFEEKYGHPMLRARHLPFRVDKRQRNLWLHCMKRALEQEVKDRQVRRAMLEALIPLADHMRNTEEGCPVRAPE